MLRGVVSPLLPPSVFRGTKSTLLMGVGPHASGDLERTLPTGLVEWRVRVTADSSLTYPADVYLLNCSDEKGVCRVEAQQQISASAKTLTVDKPQPGNWRIVVRSRDQASHAATYSVHEALLVSTSGPIEQTDSKHSNGATWTLPLPNEQSGSQYAAFRIAATPGNEREKNGLVIAMTPLDKNAP